MRLSHKIKLDGVGQESAEEERGESQSLCLVDSFPQPNRVSEEVFLPSGFLLPGPETSLCLHHLPMYLGSEPRSFSTHKRWHET